MVSTMVEQFGIGDNHALPAARPLLRVEECQMAGIHFRNDERHIGIHAMIARIGHDDVAGLRELAFNLGGDGGVHSGEHEARSSSRGFGIGDNDFGRMRRDIAIETPGGCIFEFLAGGTITRSEPSEIEPGMTLQETNEMLAHHAGAAENAYFDSSSLRD